MQPVASVPVAPPVPPPPTLAAQHETVLIELGARLRDDGLYLTLPIRGSVSSDVGELMSADADALDRLAGLMKERSELEVAITGYTGSHGKQATNERGSLQRAEVVRDYLVMKKHVDPARVALTGEGSADSVASNDTEPGRYRNWRVVLRVMTEDGRYRSRSTVGAQQSDVAP